jgi:hypothetical protein
MTRFTRFFIVTLLLFGLAPGALAAPPTQVDPSTLTPPPNPNFQWDCSANGQRILCTGVEESSVVNGEDPAFSCDGRQILVSFTQVVTSHRTHDAEGRVIRNHQVGSFDEEWRLEGTTGPVLRSRGRWTVSVDYAEPGVVESRTNTYTGTTLALSAPGQGLIFHTTGRLRLNWDESEVLAVSGPQDFLGDLDGVIEAACTAFGV